MSDHSEANKRIAKNTMLLYGRMGLMMIISFFTARITLEALGVVNYGINNIVGGLVSMFAVISNSLSSSVSRFITFGLGEGDKVKLNRIFITAVNIHIILAIIVVIAIETIGVWFLVNKMVIPPDRLTAAHWVLQCSTISFAIGLLSTPYNAAIIAHEKMGIYAYFSIFDAISRLAIVFSIKYYGGDKLILLAIISLFPTIIKQFYYQYYCRKSFSECHYKPLWDKILFKEMFSFAGWNFIGASSALLKDQGVNIAINLFHSPAVNAARGIAMQISSIIEQFTSNISIAVRPQITKEYAAKNYARMHNLMYIGTKAVYFLFMTISIPIFFEIETILCIWLGQVPQHTVLFTRLVLILCLSDIMSSTLIAAQWATGRIRNYQIVVGGTQMLNFPISYILLRLGFFPEVTLIVAIIISQLCLVERLFFTHRSVKLPSLKFTKEIYFNAIVVTITSAIIPAIFYFNIHNEIPRFFLVCISSVASSFAAIYVIGLKKDEKKLAIQYIQQLRNKLKKR